MLKLVVLKTNSKNKTEIAIARGEALQISEHSFCNSIKNRVDGILPAKGRIFKKKKWKKEEIRVAIEKAISEISSGLKRKTINM